MNIYLDMVGCRLNQSEIEKFALTARKAGHCIVADAAKADLAIVNTCTVTSAAAADSRKVIRRIARAGCKHIISTGCLSTIDPGQVQNLPAVKQVIGNQGKETLIDQLLLSNKTAPTEVAFREPIPGKHRRTRAFIKVQDGCDNFCTFCITRLARGKSRSVDKMEIFKDVERALSGDVKEIVLTGVNIGSWGRDLDDSSTLACLIEELITRFDPPRTRLSSIEPWDLEDRLIALLDHPAFCPHLHIPLQSGCDATLRRMGRRISTAEFTALVEKVREKNEITAVTTDIIVGFAGETEKEFAKSLAFIEKIGFADGHVFRYSPRSGTPAASYVPALPEKIKKERSRLMRAAIEGSQAEFQEKMRGKITAVLWERSEKISEAEFQLSGISKNYLPIVTSATNDLYNEISLVEIVDINNKKIEGRIIS